MPLFEYECRDCGRTFEAFVTSERAAGCPGCEGSNLSKLLSRPGMVGTPAGTDGWTQQGLPSGSCGAGGPACACRANGLNPD